MARFELLAVGAQGEPEIQRGGDQVQHFLLVIDAAGILDAALAGNERLGPVRGGVVLAHQIENGGVQLLGVFSRQGLLFPAGNTGRWEGR